MWAIPGGIGAVLIAMSTSQWHHYLKADISRTSLDMLTSQWIVTSVAILMARLT